MITKTKIMDKFKTSKVIQYGSKQLFLVDNKFLVSYETIVAKKSIFDEWIITDKHYSATTKKHINFWLKIYKPKQWKYGTLNR